MKTTFKLFGGIEGGATKTLCKLMTENGDVVASAITGPSNPWILGIGENEDGFVIASSRVYELILKCLSQIGNSETCLLTRTVNDTEYTLTAIVLCLSGAGCKTANERITKELQKLGLGCQIYVGNDTLAPVFTSFKNGGLVIISGTGSKCVLVNPLSNAASLNCLDDIPSYSSGGWGNLLGDEGSAYWIAQKAIKFVLDYNDNFLMENDLNSIEHEAEEVKQLIFQHFKIDKFDDLLPYFYSDFKKDFIASLAAKLSIMAKQNDVVREIFEETGYQIARHIMALVPKIDKRLFSMQNGLPIVCAGSVFKSWSLIKPGFVQCLNKQIKKYPSLNELNLVLADSDSSIGACLLASKLYDNKIDLINTYKRKSVALDHFYVNKFQNFHQCETELFSTNNLIPKEV